jgi:type I restriction-modification system DNA methylase subunit
LAGGTKTPEQQARDAIDQQLLQAGWLIQNRDEINLSAGRGFAIREFKMADERAELTGTENPIPAGYRWSDLAAPTMEGARLEEHYRQTLTELGKQGGMLGIIFRKAQNKIQDPAKLRHLIVELIGKETWIAMSSDVKGDAYEGLLEKNAEDTKSGAGQYFTPRALIDALVDVLRRARAKSSATLPAAPVVSCFRPTTISPPFSVT